MDDKRNLAVCPLLHDGNFMQVFYEGWQVAQAFLRADAKMPPEVALPRPPMRELARMLVDRRAYPVLDVVDAFEAFAQPELLATQSQQAQVVQTRGETEMRTVLAAEPQQLALF